MHPVLQCSHQLLTWNALPDVAVKTPRHRFVSYSEVLSFRIELQSFGMVAIQTDFENKPDLFSAGVGLKHR